ncbi:hypothetical protein KW429_16495 [Vibrio fluvialis]|nr:hypothetical protein [Vibrio fluvialis]
MIEEMRSLAKFQSLFGCVRCVSLGVCELTFVISLVVGLQFILFDKYLRDMPLKLDIVFTSSPSDEEIDRIYQGLKNFNQRAVPEVNDETFAILVRDEQGNVVGGLTGVFL